jgi:hypothetical protein
MSSPSVQAFVAWWEMYATRDALLHARQTLRIIGDGGLIEAPAFRPRVFGYRVSRRAFERRVMYGERLPFGWAVVHELHTSSIQLGPWWLLGAGIFWRWFYYEFCHLAIRVGLARAPSEDCYLHELIWFPDAPRFE